MAKKAVKRIPSGETMVDREAAESMEKAKRLATRGEAKAALDEFQRFNRSPDDYHTLVALHPDIQVMMPRLRNVA